MSGFFRAIGKVAGVISTIAAFIPGGQVIAGIGKAAKIASIAAAVSTVAMAAAQLTAKRPAAKGQVTDRVFQANHPLPYMIGRSYSGGVQLHDVGYGGRIDKVDNPYRFLAAAFSCCGPVEELESVQFDYRTLSFSGNAATGYYANFAWRDYQLGARPEASALAPQWAGAPDWGSTYGLAGFAAIGFSLKWDKKAKRFPGGQIPAIGAVWKGVKVYDPRLDSTYPGGSGAHRIDDETTWEYSRNPALHALAYAYGRYVNGVKIFGVDLGADAIDLGSAVAWANVCEANDWFADGTIYEPGDGGVKWNNLKRICEAGGGEPVLAGGLLKFDYQAPRISLATVGVDDLADSEVTARLGRGWKDRHNTMIARFRSEAHQWSFQQIEALAVADFVTEDGEEKFDERQFDLVTDATQAAQLVVYDLYQRREAGPISFACKSHMRDYEPGDCLTLGAGLGAHPSGAIDVVIRKRSVDPMTGTVTFEVEQDTADKHTEALAAVGVAPASGATIPSWGEMDGVIYNNANDFDDVTFDSSSISFDSTVISWDAT